MERIATALVRRPRGRPRKNDWEELTQGDIWTATKGIDFNGDPSNFRTYLYKLARQRDMKVETRIHGDLVQFRFRRI